MTLDELLATKSPRSDASLLDDVSAEDFARLRETLGWRFALRALTLREREVAEVLGLDVSS